LDAAPPARTRPEYFARWSQLHGGVEPESSWLIKGWLTMSYAVGRPLARAGFSPNAVTMLGVLVAAAAPALVWLGVGREQSGWLWLAVVACALSGLIDNLDGVVAVITGRTTRWGHVLDSVADRLSDCALLAALWLAGAAGVVVVAAGILTMIQEYARARAGVAGMSEVGVVSVWERPTRIAVVAVFVGLAAWTPFGVESWRWADLGAGAALALAVVGTVQVLAAIRRALG